MSNDICEICKLNPAIGDLTSSNSNKISFCLTCQQKMQDVYDPIWDQIDQLQNHKISGPVINIRCPKCEQSRGRELSSRSNGSMTSIHIQCINCHYHWINKEKD